MHINSNLVPMVISRESGGERAMDIYSRLLQARIIDLSSGVDPHSCSLIRSSLLYLQNEDSESDINMYIDSPGGHVMSGMSVVDTMRIIKPKVNVFCTGMAASMGSVILAGATGKRFVLPHSQVMLHQVSSGAQGQVEDMLINTIHGINLNTDIMKFFAKTTGRSKDEIKAAMNRDTWFTAQQAIDFGLADEIVESRHPFRYEVDESEFTYYDHRNFN